MARSAPITLNKARISGNDYYLVNSLARDGRLVPGEFMSGGRAAYITELWARKAFRVMRLNTDYSAAQSGSSAGPRFNDNVETSPRAFIISNGSSEIRIPGPRGRGSVSIADSSEPYQWRPTNMAAITAWLDSNFTTNTLTLVIDDGQNPYELEVNTTFEDLTSTITVQRDPITVNLRDTVFEELTASVEAQRTPIDVQLPEVVLEDLTATVEVLGYNTLVSLEAIFEDLIATIEPRTLYPIFEDVGISATFEDLEASIVTQRTPINVHINTTLEELIATIRVGRYAAAPRVVGINVIFEDLTASITAQRDPIATNLPEVILEELIATITAVRNPQALRVTNVIISNNKVTLTLSEPVAPADEIRLDYIAPANNPISDLALNVASSLTNRLVTNNTP